MTPAHGGAGATAHLREFGMIRYLLSRLGQMAFVFLGVTALIFVAVWAIPGDPIRNLVGPASNVSEATMAALRSKYGLDQPLHVQYLTYMWRLLHGDLGVDFYGRSISSQLALRWPITAFLAGTALLFEALFGCILGTIAALRRGRLADHVILVVSTVLLSVPFFVLANLGQYFLGIKLGIVPVTGSAAGWPAAYLLPGIVLGALGAVGLLRLVRTEMTDGLLSDFARTAKAKGLRSPRILIRHVLRAALIPIVTILSLDLGYLLGGAIVIESIFNLPGIGLLLYQGIQLHQGPVVVAIGTVLVLIFLVTNLLADVFYSVLDPRVRRG